MLFFELITHEVPFANPLPPSPVKDLITHCWHTVPTERPSFEVVRWALAQLPQALTTAEFEWLDAPHGHPVSNNPQSGGCRDAA